jgi:hypothetical protein
LLARVNIGDEGFDAVGNKLDGPAEKHSYRDGRDLVGVKVNFNAERAPHMRTHHPYAPLVDPQMHRIQRSQLVRCSVTLVDCQAFVARHI